MLLLIMGTFTSAYPLMYFAQESIPLNAAIFVSAAIVVLIIAVRSITIMGIRLGLFGTVFPAIAILTVTLVAAIHPRLQGILITGTGLALFIGAMLLSLASSSTGRSVPACPALFQQGLNRLRQ